MSQIKIDNLSNEEILDGILKSDSNILTYIYKSYFPIIESFILNNNGNTEAARDIFQEAIIVIYRTIQKEDLRLKSTFKTYLFSICKSIWIKELTRKSIKVELAIEMNEIIDENDSVLDISPSSDISNIFQKHFNKLDDQCKRLLKLLFEGKSNSKTAEIMGYRSGDYVKNRKIGCKQKLINNMKNDPEYKEIVKKNARTHNNM